MPVAARRPTRPIDDGGPREFRTRLGHYESMKRTVRVIGAIVIFAVGTTLVALLFREGLDRAEKWISALGMPVTLLLSAWTLWWPVVRRRPVVASGVASAAVGGNNVGAISTRVRLPGSPTSAQTEDMAEGVHATGSGAVAVGGDNAASIRTDLAQGYHGPAAV